MTVGGGSEETDAKTAPHPRELTHRIRNAGGALPLTLVGARRATPRPPLDIALDGNLLLELAEREDGEREEQH